MNRRNIFKIFFSTAFLLIPNFLKAEISTIWFVWGSSFTIEEIRPVLDWGKLGDKLALKRTWIDERIRNGISNYTISITTITDAQSDAVLLLQAKGKIYKIGESEFKSVYNPYLGSNVESIDYRMIDNPPVETRYDFQVEKSTP